MEQEGYPSNLFLFLSYNLILDPSESAFLYSLLKKISSGFSSPLANFFNFVVLGARLSSKLHNHLALFLDYRMNFVISLVLVESTFFTLVWVSMT